jgi:16S rRNA C1402 (ribose-2'-O) methylase RsmI
LQQGLVKGEFTIIVHGYTAKPYKTDLETAEYLKNLILHRGLSKKEAVATAAEELGLPKKVVYKESLKI